MNPRVDAYIQASKRWPEEITALHVARAGQAKTGEARIDKHAPKILAGKGRRDR